MVFQNNHSFQKLSSGRDLKERKGRGQLKQFRDHEIDRIQYLMKTLISNAKVRSDENDIKDMREYKETMRQN